MEGGSAEGEKKIKRKMKTASQLEILEKAYSDEPYPSEALRAELSVKLGLSDRQLQMWFCHRRHKDRKMPSVKRPRKFSPVAAECGEEVVVGMGLDSFAHMRRLVQRPGVAKARIGGNVPSLKKFYESQQSIAELRAVAFVEAQLGESLREDGPILGMEFDPLPPGAFGSPIGAATGRCFEVDAYKKSDAKQIEHHQVSGRTLHEYKFLPEEPTVKIDRYQRGAPLSFLYGSHANFPNDRTSLASGHSFLHGHEQVSSRYCSQGQMLDLNNIAQQSRQGHLSSSSPGEHDNSLCNDSLMNIAMDPQCGVYASQLEYTPMPFDQRLNHGNNVLWIQKKLKNDEGRVSQEVEAYEKRIQKELEKQDVLRRKREEQIRKEMERHDREKQREEERLMREKQKEEERCQRQLRHEMLKREKFMQKESIRAERMKQKEALRRERDAARLKAANQRAIARRVAKESMELAEDERLELMELAVSSKGLPSIVSLDHETLQNLESFEDMKPTFPPKSVLMKKPFPTQPWADSEENVGNLLTVWKFLVTFADVLGLWPFTLDEFVQAFHDYDPRLLGEIHVALLRCILKDIEDVARTPSAGLGVNQNSATNAVGGHPEIVEGAYAWGFDICSWQHHLNPLTWPEILRQFALSAGFGPQLVKGNVESTYLREENEGNDVDDIISNLRNGLAVENAVTVMLEKGFSNPRRSRHCLTPGTVKFAAFHVLSLEGSKGLTIVEVADKIQKSGLRDLTTSRKPEASIVAALSRDSKLFERTAPSTYCVRSPYRKDPADISAILSAARERIRIYKSGLLDGEDAERDEDSEVDVTEDPEVGDLGTEADSKKEYEISEEGPFDEMASVANGKEPDEVTLSPKVDIENGGPLMSMVRFESRVQTQESPLSIYPSIFISGISRNLDDEDSVSDEGDQGEHWVRGLTEGEYSELSVEGRLNALCSLIGVVLEGNSIRTVLEERLDAANGLKKQMLAEVQLHKRRVREEYVMQMHESFNVENKSELKVIPSTEGRKSPILNVGGRNGEGPLDPGFQQEHCSNSQTYSYFLNDFSERNLQVEDPVGADNSHFQHSGLSVEKSRSQVKSYIGQKAEEMYVYRSLSLGQDRRRNRYWQFSSSTSRNEPGNGRIFVELHNGSWRLVDSIEGFDALLASLDVRGIREFNLHGRLQKLEGSFKAAVQWNILEYGQSVGENCGKLNFHESASDPDYCVRINNPDNIVCPDDSAVLESSTSFVIEFGGDKIETLKRYQDFERWMWRECSSSILSTEEYGKKLDRQLLSICNYCRCIYSLNVSHCCNCHQTYNISDIKFSEHMAQCKENIDILFCPPSSPLRIRLIKLLLTLIEVSIPIEAFQPSWTDCYRKCWGSKLQSSSSPEELLQVLTLLESSVKQDFLCSNYETTCELLARINPSGSSISHSSPEIVPVLPWMPLTTSAVALRLLELDASISYIVHQKIESQNKGSTDEKLLSNFTAVKTSQDSGTAVISNERLEEANWTDCGFGLSSSEHRKIERGGKQQKKINSSRLLSDKSITDSNQGGIRRGRRSVRSRQKSARKMEFSCDGDHPEETVIINEKSSLDNHQQWNDDQNTVVVLEEGDVSASSSDRMLFADDGYGDEYVDVVVDPCGRLQTSPDYVLHGRSYEVDEDKEDYMYDGKERGNVIDDEHEDLYVEGYINGNANEEGDKNLGNNMVLAEEIESASDYSD